MNLYPAVDIKNGCVVRLLQGRADQESVYGHSPLQAALRWQAEGAEWLHVVDLDAAFTGEPQNLPAIRELCHNCGVKIQLGGGIRTLQNVEDRLQAGVTRVVLGTAAVTQPGLLAQAVRAFGAERIACGIDVKNGKVAIRGWVETAGQTAMELAQAAKKAGIRYVIYTDIAQDGMLRGPDMEGTKKLVAIGLQVIASGGVAAMEHLLACRRAGCEGAIIGQALYTGKINLAQALQLMQTENLQGC